MIYMREPDQNYDQWALTGDMSWSWDNSLPHFMLHEDHYRHMALHGARGTPADAE
jgi:choline dehydrogenase